MRLQPRFPNSQFVDTGYANLDPLINNESLGLSCAQLGLDSKKNRLFYMRTAHCGLFDTK